MKVRFTKASSRDGDRVVTCRLAVDRQQGDHVMLVIKPRWSNNWHYVMFTVNRKDGSTLKTTEWPKRFAKPSVGSPIDYEVVTIIG
jgi:hypothetical protein